MVQTLHAIVLAAGKGKRMNSRNTPKVVKPIGEKPMVSYVVAALRAIGIARPVVVVGFEGQQVINALGKDCDYVWQKNQLGTGHAALHAQPILEGLPGYTFIVNGDNPLISEGTLKQMLARMRATQATVAIASVKAPDSLALGRLITDKNGHVVKIVEEKNAQAAEKRKFQWKNAGPWLVDNTFLWQALPRIKKNELSGEYYLTDLLEFTVQAGRRAIAVPVTHESEAIGVNTPEHLARATAEMNHGKPRQK